jgi:maltose O-acetyltransferase
MINKTITFFFRGLLRLIPLMTFPKLNVWIFRQLGFDIAGDAKIYSSVQIFGNISVKIGNGTFIGHQSVITGGLAKIEIGSNCDISDRVSIFCGTHKIGSSSRRAGNEIGKDIKIGNGVWIGYGALILPGVTIGNGVIIAAGSVVNKNVEENTLVGGNPMRIIRKLSNEEV